MIEFYIIFEPEPTQSLTIYIRSIYILYMNECGGT